MPIISPAASAATNSTQSKNEMKPIGICLSSNSNLELPTMTTASVTNLATNPRSTTNATNSNNFYAAASTVSSTGQFQMGPLSVMVAKFTSNPSNSSNRQQTVILQPRINTTRATALQMNPLRGPTVITSQNISTTLTSTTSSISVRTRVLSGQTHQANTLPVLNLTTTSSVPSSNLSTTNTVKQMISGQKYITTSGNVETVNLVMTKPNEVRGIRTNAANSNEMKTNMLTVHNINKVNGPKTVIPGSTIVTAQPKMISISNAGQPTGNVCQRLEILGTSVGASNKSGIINLATSMPKSFIFTSPNATLTGSGATIANMVSISSANFVPTGQSTTISVTPNHITSASRHSVTATNNLLTSNLLSTKPTIYTVATTNANLLNSVTSLTTTALTVQHSLSHQQNTSSSAIISTCPLTNSLASTECKPTILTSNLSPIKPTIQQTTPCSPRPRILSRKRIQGDSPTFTMKTTNGPSTISINQPSSLDQKPIQRIASSNEIVPCSVVTNKSSEGSSYFLNNHTSDSNLTPRKKPRKQLLEPSSPKSKDFDCEYQVKDESVIEKEPLIIVKKPRPSLLSSFHSQYKSQPHFLRHTDVKQKQDKKIAISDLINDVQKQNGWKNHNIAEQLKKSAEDEKKSIQKSLENFLKVLEQDISPYSTCASKSTLYGDKSKEEKLDFVDRICVKINDLTRANIQRTKIIIDHYNDSNHLIVKLTSDHKEKLSNMTKKITHKRGYIK